MRIASKIGFGERPSDTRTLVKRYFMAFEGKIDEFNYFTGLFYHLRKKHVHHPFIEIIAFKRSPEHNGHSNPLSVVKQIEMAITTGKVDSNIRYQEVVEEFLASVDDGTIRGKQRSAYYEFAQKTLSKENLSLSDIAETTMLNTLVTNLYSRHTQSLTSKEGVLTLEEIILAYQDRDGIHYDENLDEVCIIVDRDQASFT